MKNDANAWHPLYPTVGQWLAAEAGPPDLEIRRPRRRRRIIRQVKR